MSAPRRLAVFNWGRLRYDWDDPRVADFADNLDRVNAVAERAPGFVWYLPGDEMEAAQLDPDGPLGGDPRLACTLSVWETIAQLKDFAFATIHNRFYRRREEWFDADQGPRLVMWHIAADHRPDVAEAMERRAVLEHRGETAEAFGWAWAAQHEEGVTV